MEEQGTDINSELQTQKLNEEIVNPDQSMNEMNTCDKSDPLIIEKQFQQQDNLKEDNSNQYNEIIKSNNFNFYVLNYHLRKNILGFLSFKELKHLLYTGKQMHTDILNYYRTHLSKLHVTDTLRFENQGYRVFFKEFGQNLRQLSIFCQGINYMETINSLPDQKIEVLKLIMCPSFWLKQRQFYRLLKMKFAKSLVSLQIQVYMQIQNNKLFGDCFDQEISSENSLSFQSNNNRRQAINQINQQKMLQQSSQMSSAQPATLPFLQAFWSSFQKLTKISMKEVHTFLDLTADYNLLLQSIFTSPNLQLRVLKVQNMLIPTSLLTRISNHQSFQNYSNPFSQTFNSNQNSNSIYNNQQIQQQQQSNQFQQSNSFQQQSNQLQTQQSQSNQMQQQSESQQQINNQTSQQINQIQNNQIQSQCHQLSQLNNINNNNYNSMQNQEITSRTQINQLERQSQFYNPNSEMTISFSQIENFNSINRSNNLNNLTNNNNQINNSRPYNNSSNNQGNTNNSMMDMDMDELDTIGFEERDIKNNKMLQLNSFNKLETFKVVCTRNSSSFMGINDSTLECLLKILPKTLNRFEILDYQSQSNLALSEKCFSERLLIEFIQQFCNLRKLSINCYKTRQSISNFALLHLAQTYSDLSCLGLASCNSIESGILNQIISNNCTTLQEICMDYTQLEGALNLLVQSGARLKRVSINYCKRINKEEIINFCSNQNCLEIFQLKQVRCFTKKALIPLVHNNYKSLKSLILEGNKIDNTHIAYVLRYCRNLQSLAIRKMDKIHHNFSNMLFSHIKSFSQQENYPLMHEKLTYLDISYNPSFNNNSVSEVYQLFPNLYTFILDSCSITSLYPFIPLSYSLNSLNLSGNPIIIKHENQFLEFCEILQKFNYLNTIFIEIPNIDMLLKHSNFVWNTKPIIIKESFNMCCYPITRSTNSL